MPPMFPVLGGVIQIPEDNEKLKLSCPGTSILLNGQESNEHVLKVTCPLNSNLQGSLKVDGHPTIAYKDIRCSERPKVQVVGVKGQCTNVTRSLLLSVGYRISTTLASIYDVCVDINEKIPIYTKAPIDVSVDNLKREYDFETFKNYNYYDYDSLFNCKQQVNSITRSIGKYLGDTSCCFRRSQLVNARDVFPSWEMALFNNINIVPQWSSCNTKVSHG